MGSNGECEQCPVNYVSDVGSTSMEDCTPCPAGSKLMHPLDSKCILSLEYEDIITAQGWRIWAPDFHLQSNTWDVDELEFYEDADCNSGMIDTYLGSPIDSAHIGDCCGPENAFGQSFT